MLTSGAISLTYLNIQSVASSLQVFRATGDSLNHFVHVLEPHDAAHVVEVVAHGEHDVIAGEAAGLLARIVQKLSDLEHSKMFTLKI
jgi:hypothetical protein